MQTVLIIISILLFVATFLPIVRNDYWIFRILEYPRFQKFLLCLIALICWPVASNLDTMAISCMTGLGVASAYLLYKIFPYTFFSPVEMKNVHHGERGDQLSLFTANVYQKNRDHSKLLSQIRKCDPDMIFLVETDEHWEKSVESLTQDYPFSLKKPLDNTYGLLFFSRLNLRKGEVRFLVENDVPSVDAQIELKSGQTVQLWGLHPKPPVPGEDERSTAKDKELMKVATQAEKCPHPVIVTGDLNDVAWSYTTELFRKTSHLLDPRRGRGFYSTFNAKNFLMRFPLDYVFCSNDFGLLEMKRLPRNGSDHFAMFIRLQYDPSLKKTQKKPHANAQEQDDAADKRAGRGKY